ncbi:hypothetical protein [Paraburkholderia sp. RL17-373-BIF-A]|uniref:hypothetical protein n=1 Tax=Paraburkholderia sp. RL17-373-BIF-A TaxID=3031629 RepID=UPI0038BCC948
MNIETLLANDLAAMAHIGSDASNAVWRRDDIEWFVAHPDRSYRLRRTLEGEPLQGVCRFVLVKQTAPGVWLCAPAYRAGFMVNKASMTELLESSDADDRPAYFDLVLQLLWRDLQTRKFRPLGVIYAQANALQAIAPTTRQ